jgi:predicted amidohydrolase YtcJ
MDIVMKYYPKPSKHRRTEWIQNAMFELNKHGIVGMHDAGVVPADLKLYEELSTSDAWTVRVYAMAECDTRNNFCAKDVAKISTPNGKFHMQSVKLFAGKFPCSLVQLCAHTFQTVLLEVGEVL